LPETAPERTGGWYFEDFLPGQMVRTMGRTVTEADIVNFVTWAGIFEETFINADFARNETLFKARVAPGFLALVLAEGLYVLSGHTHHGRALLGLDEVRLTAPVTAGDTIYAEVAVVEARPSASRPGNGVVTLSHSVRKGEGVEVMRYRTTRLIESRDRKD
jgi:acyl dehydratase